MDKRMEQAENRTLESVYAFLVKYMQENGYAPCIREICRGAYLSSTSSIHKYLHRLEQMGRIEMKGNAPRAIKLVGYKLVKMEE